MSSSRLFFFMLIPVIFDLVAPATAQKMNHDGVCTFTADFCWRCSSIGSIYQENLNNLMSNFSNNTEINYGFYHSSMGQDPNKVNAIALCRGDISLGMYQTCVKQASQLLFQNCSHQKEAILWAQPCMVRYSSKLILGIQVDEPIKYDAASTVHTAAKFLVGCQVKKLHQGTLKKICSRTYNSPRYQAIYATCSVYSRYGQEQLPARCYVKSSEMLWWKARRQSS